MTKQSRVGSVRQVRTVITLTAPYVKVVHQVSTARLAQVTEIQTHVELARIALRDHTRRHHALEVTMERFPWQQASVNVHLVSLTLSATWTSQRNVNLAEGAHQVKQDRLRVSVPDNTDISRRLRLLVSVSLVMSSTMKQTHNKVNKIAVKIVRLYHMPDAADTKLDWLLQGLA